ncbi:hypothetical protein R50073_34400 [Maricurvus nonylphenolicus]|uniref:zinc ribbon-containing protein n=1 Tax=Maricurvus nonylphenolicus TaxID=1008307 RepID=UPI0036F2F77D
MANLPPDNSQSPQDLGNLGVEAVKAASGAHLETLELKPPTHSGASSAEGFWQELRDELLLLETRTGHWLLQAADPTCLARIQLQQRIDSGESIVMKGEIICDRDIQCLDCGSTFHAHGTVTLAACQSCGGDAYGELISH